MAPRRVPKPWPRPRGDRAVPRGLESLSGRHSYVSQELITLFQWLRVGATLCDETGWYAVHAPEPTLVEFDYVHGALPDRYAYNSVAIERLKRERRLVLSEREGFSDYWVPIALDEPHPTFLVTGPFATRRSTASDVLERWRRLTGRQGHPSDPEFAHYLAVTLETLVLEGDLLHAYGRWLECYAELVAGRGDAHALSAQAKALQDQLLVARRAELVWKAAHKMTDALTERAWHGVPQTSDFLELGIEGVPEHVLVGLSVNARGDADVVEEWIARDAFQRRSVSFARREKMVCGKVGDHGVMFLLGAAKSVTRRDARVRELSDELATLARKEFGFRVHFGVSARTGEPLLSERYAQALRAAERALSEGLRLVFAEPETARNLSPLRQLKRELGAPRAEAPAASSTRFERYIDAVVVHSGYRIDAVRTHLEVGFDQVAQALLSTDALTEKNYLDACQSLDRAARDAATVTALCDVYRRAVTDMVALTAHPTEAVQDYSLRRATTFIQSHYAEPLSLGRVAQVAGFAPRHFSRLFQKRERMTLDAYVRRLRVKRAKELLKSTDLSAERISALCGFRLRPYFYRVFTDAVGMTPLDYRRGERRTRKRART